MNETLISIRDLSFRYGNSSILEAINLEIRRGDFFALIGPNGGGKTTLLKLMSGLLSPSSGQITIGGKNPRDSYSRIGYVPQNTNLNMDFPITALEVVLMGHECEKRPFIGYGKHEIACAEGALAQVGMQEYGDQKIGALSGGQRQRILIARALCAHNTEILFLDEPTSNLDSKGQQQIYELLRQLNAQMTVVVVSHDLAVILDYASGIGYVNHALTYHDAPTQDRKTIMQTLGITDGHLCEVDILNSLAGKTHQGCSHE